MFLQWSEQEILIAVPGADRYEPGNMTKPIGGLERARRMFEDLRASLALAQDLACRLD